VGFFSSGSKFSQTAQSSSTVDQDALPLPIFHGVSTMTATVRRAVTGVRAVSLHSARLYSVLN